MQLLLLLARPEYSHLVVCGHWGRSGPGNCTMSIPARGAYTFSELRAAGFNASDALAYAVDP